MDPSTLVDRVVHVHGNPYVDPTKNCTISTGRLKSDDMDHLEKSMETTVSNNTKSAIAARTEAFRRGGTENVVK